MATTQGPAGPRRLLGSELRRLRNQAGLHLDVVARELECSASKISRLENGKGIPKMPDVLALLRIYGITDPDQRHALTTLVGESRESGWWEEFTEGVASERFVLDAPGRYPALESEAIEISSLSTVVLHGLIQTKAYARGVLTANLPRHGPREISSLVALRTQRQQALTRGSDPIRFSAVVDEALLLRVVTSERVMAEQLRALVRFGSLPAVSIQVLPFSAGFHRALVGQFTILGLPPSLDDVVYIEGHSGDTYLDGVSDVELYKNVFADASARALDRASSAQLINQRLLQYAPQGKHP